MFEKSVSKATQPLLLCLPALLPFPALTLPPTHTKGWHTHAENVWEGCRSAGVVCGFVCVLCLTPLPPLCSLPLCSQPVSSSQQLLPSSPTTLLTLLPPPPSLLPLSSHVYQAGEPRCRCDRSKVRANKQRERGGGSSSRASQRQSSGRGVCSTASSFFPPLASLPIPVLFLPGMP
jgi:hypothetical protein